MSRRQPKIGRRPGGHARRPNAPLRRRLSGRLPSGGRVLAILGFAAAMAAVVTLLNGPWLRIGSVAHAGARYTPAWMLDEILDAYHGAPLLSLDTQAVLRRLRALPSVADARVDATLPGTLKVTIREKQPAFIWRTGYAQLVTAADGAVMASRSLTEDLGGELSRLPEVVDERPASAMSGQGDVLPAADVRMAMRLGELAPRVIGSRARRLEVSIEPEYGFVLESRSPPWRAALGFYELDPFEDRAAADERLERQLAAIRTLLAGRREWAISWVDARNPGKVYWTP